ncbi:MAG: hypothetical protein ACRCTZ_18315 [Sarcina sp.]
MYSILKKIKLGNAIGSELKDVVIVDRISARELQNKYHQMSISYRGKWVVFNHTANVIKCLKLMDINEDLTDHSALFKIEEKKENE